MGGVQMPKGVIDLSEGKGDALLRIVEIMRQLDARMEMQQFAVFLYVGRHSMPNRGVTMQEIGEALNLPQSTTSRNVLRLSEYAGIDRYTKKRNAGLGLLTTEEDPNELRRKVVFLSKSGAKIYDELMRYAKADTTKVASGMSKEMLADLDIKLSQLKEAQRDTENFRKSLEVTLKNVQNEVMKKRIVSGTVSSKRAQGKTFARTTTNKNR